MYELCGAMLASQLVEPWQFVLPLTWIRYRHQQYGLSPGT
jgi:hypothetical protein